MIDAIAFVERPAHEIAAGNAVFMKSKDGDVLCLKVQREAKNYVQDYVVRLDPVAEPEMALEFIDPDDPLADCGVPVQFTPEELPGETTYGQHPAEHLRPGVLVDS
ncbi:MAG: hypothetical protein MI741_05220, partial [Rhodospirillales bacterium]|nr:hypothetical protein [Rhodospirillales bacterium]